MKNKLHTLLNKALTITLGASIILALIVTYDAEQQKAANARQLATAIARANDAARELAASKDYQYAIYQQQVAPYTKAIPAATLKEIKARPR